MALIKCPECKKEISDTIDSCPHCGFKLKQNKNLENIKKNHKLLIIIGIVLILVVAIFIIIINLPSDKKNAKKMVKYLESVGYNCSFDKDEKQYTCKRIEGIKQETMTVGYYYDYEYTIESKNEYKMSINSQNYLNYYTGNAKYITVTNLRNEEYMCYYLPESFNGEGSEFKNEEHWEIGDNSIGYNDLFGNEECQYDFSDKVDKMLREFEGYYKNSGVKLVD